MSHGCLGTGGMAGLGTGAGVSDRRTGVGQATDGETGTGVGQATDGRAGVGQASNGDEVH